MKATFYHFMEDEEKQVYEFTEEVNRENIDRLFEDTKDWEGVRFLLIDNSDRS